MLKTTVVFAKRAARPRQIRRFGELSTELKPCVEEKMRAWQIHSYGGPSELQLTNVRIPVISHPSDVLIKVEASSINPIDVAMSHGYGLTVLNLMRKVRSLGSSTCNSMELPLTLGRDFSGVVVSKGHAVGEKLELGDEIWGVVPVEQQGCHANYVVVNSDLVNVRPKNISYIEAASILYAGLTAWSAVWITGGLCYKLAIPMKSNGRVLVLGASGGVGTLAVQLLRAWKRHVVATCSTDAVELVGQLGANTVIDYKQDNADFEIINEGPYDIILDCCKQSPELIKSKGYPHKEYITLNSPLLKNIDELGLIPGAMKNIQDILYHNIPRAQNTSTVKWAFFTPSKAGIDTLQRFVENGKITPVIQEVYPFEELPLAYERVLKGHLRGKIVVDMR